MRDCPTSTRIYQRLFPSLHEFRIPRFLDDSSNEGMQASMMVRSYSVYMEEKLQVFRSLFIVIGRYTSLSMNAGRSRNPLRLRPVCSRLIGAVSAKAVFHSHLCHIGKAYTAYTMLTHFASPPPTPAVPLWTSVTSSRAPPLTERRAARARSIDDIDRKRLRQDLFAFLPQLSAAYKCTVGAARPTPSLASAAGRRAQLAGGPALVRARRGSMRGGHRVMLWGC